VASRRLGANAAFRIAVRMLTAREAGAMLLMRGGLQNKEIAARL
jgi:DNA-binding CsgD family transcriptional regulator